MEQRYCVGSTATQNGVVRMTTIGFTRDGVGRTPDAFEFAAQLAGLGEQAIEPTWTRRRKIRRRIPA